MIAGRVCDVLWGTGRTQAVFVGDDRFNGVRREASERKGLWLPARRWRIANADSVKVYPDMAAPIEDDATTASSTTTAGAVRSQLEAPRFYIDFSSHSVKLCKLSSELHEKNPKKSVVILMCKVRCFLKMYRFWTLFRFPIESSTEINC